MSTANVNSPSRKKLILAFVAGLLVGPLISGMLGWQITSETVRTMVRDTAVQQQVKFCTSRAREAVEDPSKLEYQERFDLAKKWAMMPWQNDVDSDVLSGCSNNLSEST